MAPPDDILRASRALGERGLEAAGRGDLHEARRLLSESAALSDDDPRYLKMLGCCAFAVGDIAGAYHAWRKAEMLLGGRGTVPWVASLDHGILRVSVDRYNSAVTLARQEKFREAVTMLDRVLEELPDFAPAGKAKGLALLGLGDQIAAHKAWSDQRERCRDDPDFDRFLAAIPVRSASPALAAAAVPPVAVAPTSPPPARLPWRTIGAALAATIVAAILLWPRGSMTTARSDSAAAVAGVAGPSAPVAATPSVAAPTSGDAPMSVAAPPPAPEVTPVAAPRASSRANLASRYQQGAAAAHRGDWARVIAELGPLSELASREPFHPHVLALLAQGYIAMRRSADARRIAFKLVQRYPESEYITDELRNIAGLAEEREK